MSRRLGIFAGALVAFGLLLGAVVHDVGKRGAFAGRYSAWSAQPDGTRAAYLTLERTGVGVARRTQDLDDLSTTDALMIVGPTQRMAKHERTAVVEWVDQGRTLILAVERDVPLLADLGVDFTRQAGGPEPTPLLLLGGDDDEDDDEPGAKGKGKGKAKGKAKGKDKAPDKGTAPDRDATPSKDAAASQPAPLSGPTSQPASQPASSPARAPASQPKLLKDPYDEADKAPPQRLVPAQPSELLAGVAEVEAIVAGTLRPRGPETDLTPLLVDEQGRTVAAVLGRRAGGRVVVIAAPDLFANRRLASRDNAVLLQALAEAALAAPAAPGKRKAGGLALPRRLELDEFHHGFTGTRTVVGYIWRGDLKWVLVQLILLGLLALWRTWKRFGPAAAPPEASQTARDYLQAMARIYRLGGHRAPAADRVWSFARRRVAARLGLSGKAGDAESSAKEIEAIGLAQLARLYRRAEDARAAVAGSGTDGDLLDFGRAVVAVEAEAQRGRGRRTTRRREVS